MNDLLTNLQPALLTMDWWLELGKPTLVTAVLGIFAVALMMLSLWVLDRVTPFSIPTQLAEKQNMAVALVVASMVIGIALVVASVAHG